MGWHMRVFVLCVALWVSFLGLALAQEAPKKNVLFLNSYHNGYAWSDTILDGARQTLEHSQENIYLQIEYMDCKRYPGREILEILYQHFQFKFQHTDFDLIIASDNHAYDFVIAYHDQLFPDVPVVFCGINDVEPEDVPMRDHMTGILENFDVRENVGLATRFHAGKKRLVVIGDRSLTGMAIANQVREQIPSLPADMSVEFWTEFTVDELAAKVRQAAQDSVFFFIPVYKDLGQEVYSAQDLLRIVWQKTHVPLYGAWEFLLGQGIVGGQVISGYDQGQQAAEIALRVLSGTSPADIPVIPGHQGPPKFDYVVLKTLGISQALLPPDSVLINAPSPFYSINRHQFWTIIISLVVLVIVLFVLMMNILERKQIEVRIKNQLSFLRTLMDTLPIPIYFTDKKGEMSGVNQAFEHWFGVRWADGMAHSDTTQWSASRFVALLDTRMQSYETALCHADQTLHPVMLHKATYADAQGQQAGIVGVIYDLSERKKAEDDLRAAEEKYRSIFENSALGIFRTAPDGSWLDANPALARMLGYASPEELIAANPYISTIYYQQSDRARLVDMYQHNQGSLDVEVLFVTRTGAVITADLNSRAVYLDGVLCWYEGFAEDVTDRKVAELALAASEAMLQLVLNTIPLLVDWKDCSLRFIGANRNFLAHVGHEDLSAIAGKTYRELAQDQTEAEQLALLDQDIIASGKAQFHLRMHSTSIRGERMWVLVNKVPLHGPQGEVVGVLTTAEDITQTVSLEKQLLQSQKMEAIGTIAGGIAHDFNNILTSIINSTELAMDDTPEGSLIWNDLDRCLRAATRGSGLIKQILTFSRPTQEGFVATDLRSVVSEAVALIRVSVPRNIDIFSEIAETLPYCLADPTQVHQIVMNLATNAFQALGSQSGTIRLSLDAVRLDASEAGVRQIAPGFYTRLRIEDTGPGIDPSIMDKIFDPFFTTKDKTEGTGLGLAVVHGIVRNHNGAVHVQSRPGATCFEIVLPTLSEVCPLPEGSSGAACQGTEHIVFVEDDEDQVEVVPRVLRQLGYTVRAFTHSAEALAAVCGGEVSVDVFITDYDMPGMSGVELARKLHACRPELPVILVSGRKGVAEFFESAENIRVFLSKPYNKDMLGRAIRDVLDGAVVKDS